MNKPIFRRPGLRVILTVICMAAVFAPAGRAQVADKLTLRQVVTLALQNSRDLVLARVQFNIALNETGVYRSGFRPNLYTGSGAAYTSGYPSVPGGGLPSVFNLSYQQSIFNLPLKGQEKAAEDRAKSAKLEVDRTHDEVIVRAATAYLDLAKVRHSLDLIRNEQASAEKILGVTKDRETAGQELPIEVTRSELTLARVRARILKLEARDEDLSDEIRGLTGMGEDRAVEVDTEKPSFSTDQQESDLLSLALQSDRSVQEAENERDARARLLKGAKGEYWPTISLVGEYQVLAKFNNYTQYFNPNLPFKRNQVAAGIQVNIPIFSSRTRADVALAKSQLNEAELMLGNKRQQVSREVRQDVRSVRELDAEREVARLDLQLAQENLQLVQAKMDQGRATLAEVEQARLDESDKWIAFLDADFARQQGQLTLLEATGQLAKVFE